MRIKLDKQIVVIAVITACGLGISLWPGGTSHAGLSSTAGNSPKASEEPILSAPAATDQTTRSSANEAYGKLPLSFEINEGQTDGRVKFLSRGAGYKLFLTSTEAVLSLERGRTHPSSRHGDPLHRALLEQSCERVVPLHLL